VNHICEHVGSALVMNLTQQILSPTEKWCVGGGSVMWGSCRGLLICHWKSNTVDASSRSLT